jgi:hypothetical protein
LAPYAPIGVNRDFSTLQSGEGIKPGVSTPGEMIKKLFSRLEEAVFLLMSLSTAPLQGA